MNLSESSMQEFLNEMIQDIAASDGQTNGTSQEDNYTAMVVDFLVENDEIDDGQLCNYQSRGFKINAHYLAIEENRIDLFVSDCVLDGSIQTLRQREADVALRRVQSFLEKALEFSFKEDDMEGDVADLINQIHKSRKDINQVRLFLLTDKVSRITNIPDVTLDGIHLSYHVWDIARLFQVISSGQKRKPIDIDFVEMFGQPISCLPLPDASGEYSCYLSSFSGELVVDLYSQFGSRLLERNVRCFLQARGNVNKGIRKTIMEEPARFMAYNNGLSAVAGKVEIKKLESGGYGITSASDFQIINGGQTTGSIYTTFQKDKADISDIHVAVKITEIKVDTKVEEIAPLISLYANSQNKVNTADFSSNHPFHMGVEELSRRILAPAQAGSQIQTRWFYERARGQYLEAKGRERTDARKKKWAGQNPTNQKYSKTDVAKFENTWSQLPHIVSRGAQKNFTEFMLNIGDRKIEVDEAYFKHLIAKAKLFKETEKIVSAQKFGGYRANIVTYTISWLAYRTAQRIDLEKIWQTQSLSPALEEAIEMVCKETHQHIVNASGGANVTEWCKKPSCWEKFKEREIDLPAKFLEELIPYGRRETVDTGIIAVSEEEKLLIEEMAKIPSDTWFAISNWAKITNNLQPWQRRLAYSLGKRIVQKQAPTNKQAMRGKEILQEAERLGFSPEKFPADAKK
jgi:hypothetical protein